jgi:hypothetical protein
MLRSSRRAVVIAASFALGLASVAPAAHAERSGSDPDTEEESGGLLPGLLDLLDPLLGDLPLLGDGFDEMGVPALDGLGLPALDGLGLPALDGLGLPALDGLGLPALDGLPVGDLLPSDDEIGGFGEPLPVGDPLGIVDSLSGPGLDLNVLAEVGLSGAITIL